MKTIYNKIRCDGTDYLHLPESERPHSFFIEAADDHGSTFSFHSDGQTVKPTDFHRATMANGNEYGAWSRNDDDPVTTSPFAIHFLWGDHPEEVGHDIEAIQAAIKAVTSEPVHFDNEGKTTITI